MPILCLVTILQICFYLVNGRNDYLSGGQGFFCAIKTSPGPISCWGDANAIPEIPPSTNVDYKMVSVDRNYGCGLHSNGTVECWKNSKQSLTKPAVINNIPKLNFAEVHTAETFVCGLLTNKSAVCWGDEGLTGMPSRSTTFDLGSMDAGWKTVCAVQEDNRVRCWGTKGTGDAISTEAPTSGYRLPSVSDHFACAIKASMLSGGTFCWGNNEPESNSWDYRDSMQQLSAAAGQALCGVTVSLASILDPPAPIKCRSGTNSNNLLPAGDYYEVHNADGDGRCGQLKNRSVICRPATNTMVPNNGQGQGNCANGCGYGICVQNTCVCPSGFPWASSILECTLSCPTIPSVANGTVVCTKDKYDQSVCYANCNTGYRLQGALTIVCSNRAWNGSFGTCVPLNGVFNYTKSLLGGSSDSWLSLKCDTGYQLVTGGCTSIGGGLWSSYPVLTNQSWVCGGDATRKLVTVVCVLNIRSITLTQPESTNYASCPPNTIMVSGGCICGSSACGLLIKNVPKNDTHFNCEWENSNRGSTTALCIDKENILPSTTWVNSPCPPSDIMIGGGCSSTTSYQNPGLSVTMPGGNNGWSCETVTSSSVSKSSYCIDYTAFRTCNSTNVCNGHGTCLEGKCTCSTGWAPPNCNTCVTGYRGPNCDPCTRATCNNFGDCVNGTCVCDAWHKGTLCEQCSAESALPPTCSTCALTCNNHGVCAVLVLSEVVGAVAGCNCITGYAGSRCEQCAANYYGYPNCKYCTKSTCINGTCNTSNGNCECNPGFSGPSCDRCADNYYQYPSCTYCTAAQTCNNGGNCSHTPPLCTCISGREGPSCNTCAPNFFNYPNCVYCTADGKCSTHGTCTAQGTCSCLPNYKGDNCDSCNNDYYAYPACKFCSNTTTCNGRGYCTESGDCQCYGNNIGPNCTQCRPGYGTTQCIPCPGGATNPCGNLLTPSRGNCSMGYFNPANCSCNPPFRGVDCQDPVITKLSPTNGIPAGGTQITITGYDFGSSQDLVTLTPVGQTATLSTPGIQITSWGASQIIAITPSGQGQNILRVWQGSRVSNDIIWKYDGPQVNSISTPRPTIGATVTLDGLNFGSNGTIALNGTNLGISSWANTKITFSLPAGTGTRNLTLTALSGIINFLVSYDPPVVSSTIPSLIPTAPSMVTLVGQNFGPGSSGSPAPVVTVQGDSCTVTSNNHTHIVCTSPATVGENIPISITVDGITGSSPRWTTLSPQITSVTGCSVDNSCASCTASCPPTGNIPITINGLQFGASFNGNVTVDGKLCTSPTLSTVHTRLECTLPAGSGYNLVVCVNRDGQRGCGAFVSYNSPLILPKTLRLNSGSPSVSGARAVLSNAIEGTMIAFGGELFLQGIATESDVTITYGPRENPGLYPCTFGPGNITATTAQCALSAGVGGPLHFRLTSAGLVSNIGLDELYYPAPLLTPGTLGLAGTLYNTTARTDFVSETNQGELILFSGENFGTDINMVNVFYGKSDNPFQYRCTVTMLTNTSITCNTQRGEGGGLILTVSVGQGSARQNVTGPLTYSYQLVPVIYSAAGCSQDPSNSNRTIGCPTAGYWTNGSAVLLTITGDYFGVAGAVVTVGDALCTQVTVLWTAPSVLTCYLPPGVGYLAEIVVSRGFLVSEVKTLLDYAPPTLFRVDGCSQSGNDIVGCPREGEVWITIIGENFGRGIPTVLVGSRICSNVSANISIETAQLTCILPAGNGFNRAITVIPDSGDPNTPSIYVSYAQCPVGYQQNGSNCTECLPGFFSDTEGATNCIPCAPGKYAEDSHSTACVHCVAGKYAPALNSSTCYDCPSGTISGDSAVNCSVCSPGTFAPQTGQSYCFFCAYGTAQNESGQTQCDSCELGTSNSIQGQQTCRSCDPGFYASSTSSELCIECAPGKYAAEGSASVCTDCPAGSYTESSAQTNCTLCPSGFFSAQNGSKSCQPCAAGKFQNSSGKSYCDDCSPGLYTLVTASVSCDKCSTGAYSPNSTACIFCSPGFFRNTTDDLECTMCEPGYFSDSFASASCELCDVGKFSNSSGASFCYSCLPGSFSAAGAVACELCAEGRFTDFPGSGDCLACLPGTIAPQNGSSGCQVCSPGFYTGEVTAATVCHSCGAGYFSSQYGAIVCNKCPEGRFGNSSSASGCLSCPAGTAQGLSGNTSCTPCPAGRYAPNNNSIDCVDCPSGKYSNNSGSVDCNLCEPGFSGSLKAAQTSCKACPLGKYAPQPGRADSCLDCPGGRFSNITSATNCTFCPEGSYQNSDGSSSCKECPLGTVQSIPGQLTCVSCTPGKYSDVTGGLICLTCPNGTYQGGLGGSACQACGLGRFNLGPGQSVCNPCDPGKFSNQVGRFSPCEDCPIGTAQGSTGQDSCAACQPGTYAASTAMTSCLDCEVGKAQPNSGATTCNMCQPGQNQTVTGQTSCGDCAPGRYSTGYQEISCIFCDAGRYSNTSRSTTCIDCVPGFYRPQAGQTSCIQATPGFYAAGDKALAALPCLAGSVSPGFGASRCYTCVTGSVSNSDLTKCVCPIGYYDSLEVIEGVPAPDGLVNCLPCPLGANCDRLGVTRATIETKAGWWRNITSNQLQFYQCLLPFHCSGGPNATCGNNREGPLCSLCVDGYRSASAYSSCDKCPEQKMAVVVAVILIAIICLALIVMYYIVLESDRSLLMLQKEEDRIKQEWNEINVRHEGGTVGAVISSPLAKLKIMLSFFQICTNLSIYVQVPWPSAYASFVRSLTFVNLDFVPWQSVGCASRFDFFTKYIIATITPLIIFALLFVFYLIPKYFWETSQFEEEATRLATRKRIRRTFWKMCLFSLFLIYPGNSSLVLSFFRCRQIENNLRLVVDVSIICSSSQWYRFLPYAVVMTILYPIGIPTFFLAILGRYRDRVKEPGVRVQVGFLYDAYHPNAYFFELCDMAHKLFLVAIVGFFPIEAQMPLAMVAVTLYLLTVLLLMPFKKQGDDRLQLFATLELYLILFCGFILSGETELDPRTDALLSAVLILVTIGLILAFLLLAFINVRKLFRELFADRLRQKFGRLFDDEETETRSEANSIQRDSSPKLKPDEGPEKEDPLLQALWTQTGVFDQVTFPINPLHYQASSTTTSLAEPAERIRFSRADRYRE